MVAAAPAFGQPHQWQLTSGSAVPGDGERARPLHALPEATSSGFHRLEWAGSRGPQRGAHISGQPPTSSSVFLSMLAPLQPASRFQQPLQRGTVSSLLAVQRIAQQLVAGPDATADAPDAGAELGQLGN